MLILISLSVVYYLSFARIESVKEEKKGTEKLTGSLRAQLAEISKFMAENTSRSFIHRRNMENTAAHRMMMTIVHSKDFIK